MSEQPQDSYLHNMCEHAGVALIGTDEHLRIRFWNRFAEQIFGRPVREVLGKPIDSVVPKYQQAEVVDLFKQALDEEKISEFEFEYIDPNNRLKHLAITISPITNHDKKHTGISLCVRDITLKTELFRDMVDWQKMSALGSMAGAVAHHFNNLIGGIITSIDFTLQSDSVETYRRTLRTTLDALTRANKLTRSLLAFAEGGQGDTSSDNITKTIKEYSQAIETKLTEKNIALQTDLESVNIYLPTNQIESILDNIIDNACEAMPNSGNLHISLGLSPDNNDILLQVSDTGTGIDKKNLDRIFEPFFTTKHSNQHEQTEHAGLGLAVVHGIVKELGGSVTLTSDNNGTVCSVSLPVKKLG